MLIWQLGKADEWQPVLLSGHAPYPLNGHAQLIPLPRGATCLLLARDGVKVNGLASLPAQVLADRDEIRSGDEIVFFSTESPVCIEKFSASEKATRCPRCKSEIADAVDVIYCPRCRSPHHAECWSYGRTCSNCDRSTETFGWSPDPPRGPTE